MPRGVYLPPGFAQWSEDRKLKYEAAKAPRAPEELALAQEELKLKQAEFKLKEKQFGGKKREIGLAEAAAIRTEAGFWFPIITKVAIALGIMYVALGSVTAVWALLDFWPWYVWAIIVFIVVMLVKK